MSDHDSATTIDHGRLGRLGAFVHRHRGRVVLAWVAALVAVLALTPLLRGTFQADFATKGSESERAASVLAQRFAGRSGDTVSVVWKASAGAQAPQTRARVQRFLAAAQRLQGIGSAGPIRVAPDRRIAATTLELDRRVWDLPDSTGTRLIDLARGASGDGLTVALGGGPIRMAEGGSGPEGFGLLGAAIVLLVAFGSIVAAGLPLAIALFGLGISASLIGVLAAVMQVPDFAPAIAGLLGIGVGIDYALLCSRASGRHSRAAPGCRARSSRPSARPGAASSWPAGTVLISVLGLFLMGVGYLQGVAVSTSLAVLVVMAAAVTLLPALLSDAGPRVNRLRLPGLGRPLRGDRPTPAMRWSRVIQRRPWTAAIVGAAIVLALAAPVLGLRLGFPDEGNDKAGSMTRTAYDLTVQGFGPGANGPLLLVAGLPGRGDAGARAAGARGARRS